ncbi:MAG: hypothetical protein Q8Q60_04945 [Candidatus Chromulinivorax sp.]|nr:hypothetical protein [Candidatus Chromulinivorax sp.]
MNKIIFTIIALTSFQFYASEQNSKTTLSTVKNRCIDIHPKISLTEKERYSPNKDKIRNELLFLYNKGCIVVMKEYLSDQDQIIPGEQIEVTMAKAVLNNDIIELKQAFYSLRLKKALLPLLSRCLPEDTNYIATCRKKGGISMLHLACQSSKTFYNATNQTRYNTQKINILKFLIKNDGNVNFQDKNGNSAMHHLAEQSYNFLVANNAKITEECIETLKKAGANINATNKNGETAILLSALKTKGAHRLEYISLLETFVLNGANINITGNNRQSVTMILSQIYPYNRQLNQESLADICKNLGA